MVGPGKEIFIILMALGCHICWTHLCGCQFLTACSGALCEATLFWGSPLPASVGSLSPSEPAEERPPNLWASVLPLSISLYISDASGLVPLCPVLDPPEDLEPTLLAFPQVSCHGS